MSGSHPYTPHFGTQGRHRLIPAHLTIQDNTDFLREDFLESHRWVEGGGV